MSSTESTSPTARIPAAGGDARGLNSQLMLSLVSAFAQNPEVDLKAFLPSDYSSHFARTPRRPKKESKLAQLNRRTINALLEQFAKDPSDDITKGTDFSLDYEDERMELSGKAKDVKVIPYSSANLPPDHFASMLDRVPATTFDITVPLSAEVDAVLRSQNPNGLRDSVGTLKDVIRNSCFLWSGTMGGRFVAKISDSVAVRVSGSGQNNHYASYEFLAEHAPDVPAPRPHGLIQFGKLSIMFFSFVPGKTLEKVWSTLCYQQKTSVQYQLSEIFVRLRKIPRGGRPLGRVDGTGVVDQRSFMREHRSNKPLNTVAEFEEFAFSYRPWIAEQYVSFLKQLLPGSRFEEPCVFTHGDLAPRNIMVDTDAAGDWKVTGIVDWEEAGFDPEYWEAVKATGTFLPNEDGDWYLTLPASISPARYPTHWLVDSLWNSMIEKLAHLDQHVQNRERNNNG